MPISNIDELLLGGSTSQHPMSPEEKNIIENEEVREEEHEEPDSDVGQEESDDYESNEELEPVSENEEPVRPRAEEKKPNSDVDEYGNEQEPENEAIRERLARQARKHQAEIDALRAQLAQQGASPNVQQAAKDFEYDPNEEGNWQQQLASFVKQTVNSMTREQQESQTRAQEQAVQQQFESKFRDGMNRFDDFREVMTSLPFEISNPMTLATRSMDNPAAFLYAAAKRHPQELERISKIRDPYGQMMEIGKLEERMRKNKTSTKAPRPLERTKEDATVKSPKKEKDYSGDDLLAKADAKRLANARQRGRNR